MNGISRRAFVAGSLASIGGIAVAHGQAVDASSPPAVRPFYVMDTGLRGPDVPDLASKVALAQRLGFSGYEFTLDHQQLPGLLDLLDKAGLELEGVYTTPTLEHEPDPALRETIARLKGRSTRIELAIRSEKLKPSDPTGDARAMELIKPISDWCGDSGPKVCIYPHTGLWSERVDDGARLADKSGRDNVGTNFNLVHWKWVHQDRPLDELLKLVLPRVLAVTINGLADNRIVSLDEGNYDLAGFVKTLKQCGYRGPVGLQGFGIPGPSADHLGRSIRAWKKLTTPS